MISGMVLVVLVIAIVLFYRNGVRSGDATPQVIGASIGAAKAPAPADQQPTDPAAGLQVYKSEVAPSSETHPAPKFAPAPEQPAPRPGLQAAAPPPAAQPIAVAALPAPVAAPQPAPAAKSPAKTVKPAEASTATAAAAGDTSKVKPPASATTAAAKPAPATAAPGKSMVQIGAFSSAALADKGWSDTAALMPDAMSGKTKKVESTVKDGATFYRAYVGGFSSSAAAQSFCASLKAAGKACFVK
jgi:hypothetical protein